MDYFTPDRRLRLMLRASRRNAGLTQKQAADIAGCDPSWWKKTEADRNDRVSVSLFARMAIAAGLTAEQLDGLGYPELAAVTRYLQTKDAMSTLDHEHTETAIAQLPGTTAEQRMELIMHLRWMRTGSTRPGTAPCPQREAGNLHRVTVTARYPDINDGPGSDLDDGLEEARA